MKHIMDQSQLSSKGYIRVPPDRYQDVDIGTLVAYIDDQDIFRIGGVVVDSEVTEDGRPYFNIKYRKGDKSFVLYHSKIRTLYRKKSYLEKRVDNIAEVIKKMNSFLMHKFGDSYRQYISNN